ncbi:MAG: polyprenyl synthetase family protein [Anaerolineaceae bacterium]
MQPRPSYRQLQEKFEEYLRDTILDETQNHPLLQEMISYHFGWLKPLQTAGKRLRPMIALLSAELISEDFSKAFPAASALEILHNYTLIHDDIVDNSDLRHGQVTLWKKYGIAHAINTGDYLSSLALVFISNARIGRPDLLYSIFLKSATDVIEGQHEDIRFESEATISQQAYFDMISQKTASLFSAAMKLGAISVGANHTVINLLGEVGYQFGIAYQIYDDYIGVWGDPKDTGKPAGIDLMKRKKSYPVLIGIQKDPEFAALLSTNSVWDTTTISNMIEVLNALGVQKQARTKISQHLDSANQQLDKIKTDHSLDVSRLSNYVNSLFKLD